MKKLSRASIKKILETKSDGTRDGALITEDNKYITNGVFFVPNTLNLNGDLKLCKSGMRGKFTRIFINRLLTLIERCTDEYKFIKDITEIEGFKHETTICKYSNDKQNIYVVKKFLQVIYQVMCSTQEFEDVPILARTDFDCNPEGIQENKVLNFLGCAIMPVLSRSQLEKLQAQNGGK